MPAAAGRWLPPVEPVEQRPDGEIQRVDIAAAAISVAVMIAFPVNFGSLNRLIKNPLCRRAERAGCPFRNRKTDFRRSFFPRWDQPPWRPN